jgi:hypothetical protein
MTRFLSLIAASFVMCAIAAPVLSQAVQIVA